MMLGIKTDYHLNEINIKYKTGMNPSTLVFECAAAVIRKVSVPTLLRSSFFRWFFSDNGEHFLLRLIQGKFGQIIFCEGYVVWNQNVNPRPRVFGTQNKTNRQIGQVGEERVVETVATEAETAEASEL